MEFKWVIFYKHLYSLGFNDNITKKGNISIMADFDVFSLWNCENVNPDLIA